MEHETRKVFISYSWTNTTHEKWVLNLAEKLVNSGVDAIIDKWDLKLGDDKFKFMEKMVRDKTIDKVLIICDKGYKEKADNRKGGVGTESQILTPELYSQIDERKYIPIISETGESFDSFVPNYAKSLIGIDMSNIANYEKGFEQLLRDIYDKPRYIKPQLGEMPYYLKDSDDISSSKLKFKNQQILNCILNDRTQILNQSIEDFKNDFWKELDKFIINNNDLKEPYDEQIFDNIEKMKNIRDEYLKLIENIKNIYNDDDLSGMIIEDLEKIYSYSEYKGEGDTYKPTIMDQFKFFIHELFIWINLLLLKEKRFKCINILTNNIYFVDTKFNNTKKTFEGFYFYCSSSDYRNTRLNLNRVCVQADTLIKRSEFNGKDYRDQIIDMDMILYFISKLNNHKDIDPWFPLTYIYKSKSDLKLIKKMENKGHFDSIKIIFGVDSKEEMIKKIEDNFINEDKGFRNSYKWTIPSIKGYIQLDKIAIN